MINFTRLLLIGTFIAVASGSASASPITGGTLDINSPYRIVGSGPTSGIIFATPTPVTNATGLLLHFDGTNLAFASTFTFAGARAPGGELLFTVTNGGSKVEFFVTGFSYSSTSMTFTGYMVDRQGQEANATFFETIGPLGTNNSYAYTGELVLTPEPQSIFLFGTGLSGVFGLIAIKRRRPIQVAL